MRGVMRGRGTSLFTRRIRVGYAPLSRGDVRATTGVLFSLGDGRLWTHSGSPFVSNRLVARSLYSHSPSQCKRSVPPLPSQNSDVASQVRTVATTDDSMSTSTDNQHFISNEGGDDHMQHHEPFTGHQQRLLEYTRSILPDAATCPVGTLSYSKLVQISNCIDQWISSGEHRYLGAEQAELLLKRLIVERGGGRSRWAAGGDAGGEKEELYKRMNLQGHASDGRSTTLRRNEDVTWHMYNFPSIVRYLNALYTGKDFVNRILSIVALFEEEFADDDSHGSDARPLEVRYKYMITCLCDCRTPHAASAAEHVLHSFESRLRGNPGYHSNPPTVETYNNVMSCWNKAQCTRYPPGMGPPGYFHHPNPCSNLLCHMLEQFDANAANMAWIKPDFLSFNTAITSLAAEQIDHTWRRGDGSGDNYQHTIGRQCHAHLMSMLELYDDGHPRCTPDLITFSTVLNTLGRGRDEGDATRAQEVLDAMLRLSGKQDGDDGGAVFEYDIVPRTRHFNIVLSLMAHAPKDSRRETLSRAERYVSIMERLGEREKEDRTTTNLPQTHNEIPVEERHVGKVDLDDETLLSMTSSAPNVITYNTLLNIAGQAGQPQKAQYILESMMRNAHIAEARAVKPDIISFNTVSLIPPLCTFLSDPYFEKFEPVFCTV